MKIAQPALAASRKKRLFAMRCEVRDPLAAVGVGDDGADGHAQHDILGAAAVLIGTAAVLAPFGAMDSRIAIIDERVDVSVGDRPDAAASAAVAAIGSAARHVLFAPERDDTVPAVARD